MNLLFLLGLALFGGTVGGRLFQKLRIPQVVGYISIGILIGESGLRVVGHDLIGRLQPFTYFALGLIGFMIGGELKKEVIVKYGKQLINISLFEGTAAFLAVSIFIGVAGSFLFGDWRVAWALGLLLGAIASATAPAVTSEVLREYKTRGPLTRTVLGVVAMDNAMALFLFAIVSSIAGNLTGNIQRGLLHPLYEIGGSIVVGIISGLALNEFLKRYTEEERLLAFSIGTILFVVGLALAIQVDMLLAAMVSGAVAVNFTPRKSKEVFRLLKAFTPPIYVLFFVLVGAKLNFRHMTLPIILLVGIYLIGRSLGKAIGSNLGTRISGTSGSVRKYLPLCLFSQAGVAIGLSILANQYFPGVIGKTIVIVITTTAFILEIVGPAFVKLAVTKAGEVGLNITEDDLIRTLKAEEVMDETPPVIYENMPLADILKIFSETSNLYYPVVNKSKKLLGIITVDSIKNTFMETGLSGWLLAVDAMEPAIATTTPKSPVSAVKELLDKHALEYLPVVGKENILAGFIERRVLDKLISTKVMELQKQADFLDTTYEKVL